MLIGLSSGEQIVAKLEDHSLTNDYLILKNPGMLVAAAEKGLGMAPWLMYTTAVKDGVTVNKNHVVFMAEPCTEIVNEYNAKYGNGLIIPTKNIETPQLQIVAD